MYHLSLDTVSHFSMERLYSRYHTKAFGTSFVKRVDDMDLETALSLWTRGLGRATVSARIPVQCVRVSGWLYLFYIGMQPSLRSNEGNAGIIPQRHCNKIIQNCYMRASELSTYSPSPWQTRHILRHSSFIQENYRELRTHPIARLMNSKWLESGSNAFPDIAYLVEVIIQNPKHPEVHLEER